MAPKQKDMVILYGHYGIIVHFVLFQAKFIFFKTLDFHQCYFPLVLLLLLKHTCDVILLLKVCIILGNAHFLAR